jgi:hypothetical protein
MSHAKSLADWHLQKRRENYGHKYRVISKDGKTLTISSSRTDEKGVAFHDTLVFHKRKID